MPKKPLNDSETAAALALQALAFISADGARASRFLSLTGLDIASLRAGLDTIEVQAAVLDHLLGDESLLLAFCAQEGVRPEAIAPARHVLSPLGD